jgi:flagellar biosynthetic protein FliR
VTDLLEALTRLSGVAEGLIWPAFLVFLRVGAAMAFIPAFGEQSVPQRVRLVLALAFAAIVFPAVSAGIPQTGTMAPIFVELAAGLILGIGLRLFIIALQIAGSIIAQSTSLSQLFGGTGPEPQPAITNLLVITGLALSVTAGLHIRVAEALILSYKVIPAGRLPESADFATWGLSQIAYAFSLGFSLAAPFTIAALLYNSAMGVINRAMPTLMVSFIGAPALTGGGLILLAMLTPVLLAVWHGAFLDFLTRPFSVAP